MESIWNLAHPWLRELVAYEPGKPIEDVARELGLQPSEIIKLASNENPLGPSPKALAAMQETLLRSHFYPDGGAYYLREAIAAQFGLERANVILGCGSNEVIEFIGKAFLNPGDEIVTARHAFVVYKLMATLFGARTVEVPDPGFAHDLDAMAEAITERTREVFIANPNNPTGTLLGRKCRTMWWWSLMRRTTSFWIIRRTRLNTSGRVGTWWCCGRFRRSRGWRT
jgi:histidinol-phosphate aminotransferase